MTFFSFSTKTVGVAAMAIFFTSVAALTPEQIKQLPPPASHSVDFAKEIRPILETSCVKCHGRGKEKGGFKMDDRESFLKGSDSGAAVVIGKSAESLLIELVMGFDPDFVMPEKGSRLKPDQIALLRAWIDQGVKWDSTISLGRVEARNLHPRLPEIRASKKFPGSFSFLSPRGTSGERTEERGVLNENKPPLPGPLLHPMEEREKKTHAFRNPVDAIVDDYFQTHKIEWPNAVDDRRKRQTNHGIVRVIFRRVAK